MCLLMGCQSKESLEETVDASVEIKKDEANIEEVIVEKDSIRIRYPKLVNLENEKIEEKWNRIIEDRITKDLDLLSESDLYNLDYEVTTNTFEKLSLKLMGSCYYDGAAQPFEFVYTYNISLTTGESLSLSKQVDVSKLASMIYQNKGFNLESSDTEEFMKYIYSAFENEELLAEMLSNFDYEDGEDQPFGYSYYKDNKLYLCIEVPHDLGDYVILEFNNGY